MKISQIPELKHFEPIEVQAVWQCFGEINGLKMPYYYLDDDEIEDRIGDYLDETYDVYRGAYTEDLQIVAPEDFDYIYSVLIDQDEPIEFDLPRTRF